MIRKLNTLALAAIFLGAAARGDEMSDKGRDIFTKNQHAVVTVQIVLKATYTARSSTPTETKKDITGTVIDPSGLTVLALSSADPGELYRKIAPEEYSKLETEVNDVKILLDDGTELPAEIVLRDKDLDLAYVRPKTKPPSAMPAVDLAKSSPAQVLDPVIALNRLNRAAGRAYSACIERIDAVIQKPRTFYVPDSGQSSASLGSPAFALNGNVIGIFVLRAVSAGEAANRGNMAEFMTPILLPAEDILKGAKQAPEAKPDIEKPAEKKVAAPATEQK